MTGIKALAIRVLLMCTCLVLSACAGYSSGLKKDEPPIATSAYIYGSFSMEARKAMLSFGGHQSMGFSLQCKNGQKYIVKFLVDAPLQLIKVAPTQCKFSELVYTDSDDVVKSRKPVPDYLASELTFAPGVAYYLGDFAATSSADVSGNMIYFNWRISKAEDKYETTTSEMKKNFPKFSEIPTENKMLGKP